MWKIAGACPRVQADGLMRLTTRDAQLALARIEGQPRGVQLLVGRAAPVELTEQGLEPERVLVHDRERLLHPRTSVPASLALRYTK